MESLHIISVTPENVDQETLFCIKDLKKPGYRDKKGWFVERYNEGLRLKILKGEGGRMIGFIEYTPAEYAWRPVLAPGYMFIHCLMIGAKADRQQGNGSMLIEACEQDTLQRGMHGIAAFASKGSWLAGKELFERNGFVEIGKKDRFELMAKKLDSQAEEPSFIDWVPIRASYPGWHLVYADQCPWHEKSAAALQATAAELGIVLNVRKIHSGGEARLAPSGFGVFNLLHDGKLLEDHYISATRFRNIVKKALQKQ